MHIACSQCYWSIDNNKSIHAHITLSAISNFIYAFIAYIKIKNSQNWKRTNKFPTGLKLAIYRWKQNCWHWRANKFFWNGSYHAVWVLSSQLLKENCEIWHEKLSVQMLFILSVYHSFFLCCHFWHVHFLPSFEYRRRKIRFALLWVYKLRLGVQIFPTKYISCEKLHFTFHHEFPSKIEYFILFFWDEYTM